MYNIKPGQYKSHDKSQKATETSQNPPKRKNNKNKKKVRKLNLVWVCKGENVFSTEIGGARVSLTGAPASRSNIPSIDGFTGGVRSDPERERLTVERRKSLVRRSPIVAHAYPIRPATFHGHALDVSGTTDVHDEDEKPICITLELKPHTSPPLARHSIYIKHIITYISYIVFDYII